MRPLNASSETRHSISILVGLVLIATPLAAAAAVPSTPPLGLEAPSMEVQSDRLLLLSDVSWTPANPGTPFVYYMTAWIMRASSGSYTLEQYTGPLQFHYRGLPNATDQPYQPGQLSLAEGGWPPFVLTTGTFTQQAVEGRVRAVVTGGVGVGAYAYSARPTAEGMDDVAWSQWVQVNNGTRYGLFDMRDYWSLHEGDSWTFDGRQSLSPYTKAVSSTSTIYNFDEVCDGACPEPPIGVPAEADANFVQLFLKTRNQGYIGYQNPWSAHTWGSGNMRCALWGWQPPAGNADDGEWVSYTAHECWYRPASQEPPPPAGDPIFDPLSTSKGNFWHAPASPQPTCECPTGGCTSETSDLCWDRDPYKNEPEYQPPEDDRGYQLTNYILAPEYVGTGWGIGVRKNVNNRYWYAWANGFDEDDLAMIPGLDAAAIEGNLLQLRFWEVTSKGRGHREDWYGDADGVLRIEDRIFRGGIGKTHQHPDGTHTQVMQQPHFCMTRQGLGACPAVR
ncbi:MAG: hypothetical protein GY719_05995 [bacterium]|nr:hypothetical protein [bacterium]